jgi:hypothetical protein
MSDCSYSSEVAEWKWNSRKAQLCECVVRVVNGKKSFFEVGCSDDFLYESIMEAIVRGVVPALWINSLADRPRVTSSCVVTRLGKK